MPVADSGAADSGAAVRSPSAGSSVTSTASRSGVFSSNTCHGVSSSPFRRARADWLAVMDADLQHPPQVLADLYATAGSAGVDIVCATRNVGSGGRDGLGAVRDLISKSFTTVARQAFPLRLRGVSDPMSGFFLVRRSAIDPDALNPTGFKILLEILVRTSGLRRAEVAYEFAPRHAGDSKASLKQGVTYLRHLARLRLAA
jgi:dolichol-phosphate mannosyltransferase